MQDTQDTRRTDETKRERERTCAPAIHLYNGLTTVDCWRVPNKTAKKARCFPREPAERSDCNDYYRRGIQQSYIGRVQHCFRNFHDAASRAYTPPLLL